MAVSNGVKYPLKMKKILTPSFKDTHTQGRAVITPKITGSLRLI
jgi:hypothetical protein